MVMIVGTIGSGKTTFLYSLMNETKLIGGQQTIKGSIAYVEQEPFIFSGSIKQNIVFGRSFEEERFNDVIRVC